MMGSLVSGNQFPQIKLTTSVAALAGMIAIWTLCPNHAVGQKDKSSSTPVSYAADIRPVLAANCFGCHQGAIDRGQYVMTEFDSLLAGGDSEEIAVVPGKPGESNLIEMITVHDGQAEMPPNGNPLSPAELAKITLWIQQGAKNDYQKSGPKFTADNPPVYPRNPVITSLDFSPDGKLLAVSGFHEVLILETPALSELKVDSKPTQAKLAKRLIGLSSRIESLKFSPDGKRLAISGGSPGESGEVQVWNVVSGELELSKTVSFDTVYGINWSPDGKMISFGCTDTTLRAIDSSTGEQLLFQGAHEDWIRDTVFSVDGSKLVSVGRDMSCKLTDVDTQRFVDNITSITPGVLKGGIGSVARHPTRDEVVIGGADGVPKVYRLERLTKRVIGDDANLIRELPKIPGRIQTVAVSADGKRIVAGSSLDGAGHVSVYSYEFDSAQPANIKAIVSKVVTSQSAAEKKTLADYITQDVKQISSFSHQNGGIFSADFHPDGNWIACGGTDGVIRIIETETGNLLGNISPVRLTELSKIKPEIAQWHFNSEKGNTSSQSTSDVEASVIKLNVSPQQIEFARPTDYVQFVVRAQYDNGATVDVTHQANFSSASKSVLVNGSFIQALNAGTGEIGIQFGNQSQTVSFTADFDPTAFNPDFVHDVNPVLTKLGCNAGTCHGSQGGKKGFKLSLRGYDPLYDIRSFTDDMGSRRTNLAAPSSSLMLLKPAGLVPHEGGQLFDSNQKYYWIIHEWIRGGAKLDLATPKVSSVELFPKNPVLSDKDSIQQMRMVATYSDGTKKDVTREAVIEIGDMEIAAVDGSVVTASRRGEAPIIGRYEGSFTATTLTVMGNRDKFVWNDVEHWGKLDELVAAKWKRMKIRPSQICSDQEFIRRVYLDLTGLPPSVEQVESFAKDDRPTRTKRDEIIDTLVGNDSYVEHWSNKWADLLQVNRKYLGPQGSKGLRNWIRDQVKTNRPYDEFAYDILTASGSNRENPAAAYYKIHRTPEEAMENTTHLFLATRFNCNKCHDHPFERWTQDQYYQTAAFFAQVDRKKDPESGDSRIGGSAVEGAKPLYEIITDLPEGEVKHVRTGASTAPTFPFDCDFESKQDAPRRAKLASWITSPDNPYFATSYVNRLWGYMNGVGLIEPLDDIRAGNPPSNPQLLEYLRKEFVEANFDSRHLIKLICKSRTYQLSVETNPFNADDSLNYSHAKARRLPAEVLFDSIHFVTGSPLKIPGVTPGTRAAALPDSGVKLPSGFLSTLGRPSRESACECERANDLQLSGVLALISGPDISRAINDPNNEITKLVATETDDRKLIDKLFMRILNRNASDVETDLALDSLKQIDGDHQGLVNQRDERKKLVETLKPELERERMEQIANAKQELTKLIAKLDPELITREKKRLDAISVATQELKEHKENSSSLAQWQKQQTGELHWHPLTIQSVQSQTQRTYEVRDDRTVILEKKDGKDVYIVESSTDLTGISAVRLELLADEKLPGNGPGLADGNYVLTELVMEIAHPDRPTEWNVVPFKSAIADFNQLNYDVSNAIDGVATGNQGWASAGRLGVTNWATFQLKLPVGYRNGTRVRFKMHQDYDLKHQIGCFRISLTKYDKQVGLGLSEALLVQANQPQAQWTPAQTKRFSDIYKKSDLKLASLTANLAKANKPTVVDPKIITARQKLARIEMPLPADATLTQLEKDVLISSGQLKNRRLTAAHDLSWALINSPSFLFNR